MTFQRYETLDQVVERTQLPKSWWYSRTRLGAVPGCIKTGRYLRFIPEKVDQWLQSLGSESGNRGGSE